MSRFSRLIPVVAVTVLLAACGQAGENPIGPSGPSFDGGIPILGGNNTQPDSTPSTGTTSGSTSTGEPETPPSDTTSRGGIPITGGN
jgi:hypothetical protein